MSSLTSLKMKKPAELVFIPFAGVGHLVSTVEIAKLLVSRDDHLFITVLIMKSPFHSKLGNNAYVESIEAASQNRIKFINLPEPNLDFTNMSRNAFRKAFMESHKPHVRDAVTELAEHDVDVTELVLPSFVNPVPPKALPSILVDKEGATTFLDYARRFRETKGILVNTFSELESHALRSHSSYGEITPVYPVGPY